jgi:hypothetical protein
MNRRQFLQQTAIAASGICWTACQTQPAARKFSANDRLNIGVIGVSNRGAADLQGVAGENIVALCDVNETVLGPAARKFPQAKTYIDFRRMLDQRDIEAVVVATPDHVHAVAAVMALKSGRHVYCEKPLSRTVSEARVVTETARRCHRVTQLGTQIHADANYRRVVELIQRDVIGPVREVHVWVAATYGGMERPKETPPVPAGLNWDLWIGPAEYRPYHPDYTPGKWRKWWAFGGGTMADFGCHYMDLPFWALDLKYPLTVEPVDGPPVHPESVPPWLIVRYQFPARGAKPPVQLTWYHGTKQPSQLTEAQAKSFRSGVLFVGEQKSLLADYSRRVLLPEKSFVGFQAPAPFIPDSIGHHKEWIQACKTGGTTTCNFDYSGPLTETALLGNVAFRTGRKLEWDPARLKAKGCPAADQYLQHHYRAGWKL